MAMSGPVILLNALRVQSVRVVFGSPSEMTAPIYDALHSMGDSMSHVLMRHEQSAAHAAVGYARASGQVGVCFATKAMAAGSFITGMNDAMLDSVPLVCIASEPLSSELDESDNFCGSAAITTTVLVTKSNLQITRAQDIPIVVAKAFSIARSGRPGPVLIELTKEVQLACENESLLDCSHQKSARSPSGFNRQVLTDTLALLNAEKTSIASRDRSAAQAEVGPIGMNYFFRKLSEKTQGGAVLVTDVDQHQILAARYYQFQCARSHITSGGLGTMGFSLPTAIGVQMAQPDRLVISVSDERGFRISNQELAVIAQAGLPLKILILTNQYASRVQQWQECFQGERPAFSSQSSPDLLQHAQAYAIPCQRVESKERVGYAIRSMLNSPGPYLLEVCVG